MVFVFAYQKLEFRYLFEGLGIERFGLFYKPLVLRPIGVFHGPLVYVIVIWYILWSFGIFCGHLV
jgi:hypothetical protein